MTPEISLWSFIINAGFVVKLILMILSFGSLMSWTIIFQRSRLFKQARNSASDFEDHFWSTSKPDLKKIYNELTYKNEEVYGLAGIFYAGYSEFIQLRKQGHMTPTAILENTERAMRVAEARELELLEQQLPFLAAVGSISPFIGLFGTVWGIMTSFQALGTAQQATIAMVAPGLSEALITTAIGLFAAIPAGLAYNRFSNSFDKVAQQYQSFQEELMNLLQREIYTPLKKVELPHPDPLLEQKSRDLHSSHDRDRLRERERDQLLKRNHLRDPLLEEDFEEETVAREAMSRETLGRETMGRETMGRYEGRYEEEKII